VWSEGKAPKNGEPTAGLSFKVMLQHTGRFIFDTILAKNNVTHSTASSQVSPDLPLADIYLFPRLKSALKERRSCDATDIIKNATDELKKVFTKRLPVMFPTLYCGCFEGN
jgi:hypothetical protein